MTVMPQVIDYSWWRPALADLKAAGIVSVCRYLAPLPNGKVIDKAEYGALRAAGIGVVLNWESSGTSYTGGYAAGKAEGAEARRQARALGHPDSRPIIQSVDIGVEPSQALIDYQRGFNDGGGCGRQGFYGDGACADMLFGAGLISVYWQANARGWPGSSVDDPRAALVQRTSHSFAHLPANQYDESDIKLPDYGQQPAPVKAPVVPPAPRPTSAVIRALQALAALLAAVTRTPLRYNDTGPRVHQLNALLENHGYHCAGWRYGDHTAAAIADFKRKRHFGNDNGKVCGRACILALFKK